MQPRQVIYSCLWRGLVSIATMHDTIGGQKWLFILSACILGGGSLGCCRATQSWPLCGRTQQRVVEPGHGAEDEINVPIALSAFRDKLVTGPGPSPLYFTRWAEGPSGTWSCNPALGLVSCTVRSRGFLTARSLSQSSECHRASARVSWTIHNEFCTPKPLLSF